MITTAVGGVDVLITGDWPVGGAGPVITNGRSVPRSRLWARGVTAWRPVVMTGTLLTA
jgi:hypothetical protein